ncbi:subtilisin-like protease SBT3.3 [Diospyros lotus]|uniref:subtilisin-like protease SBT3.3 n=1 Tax=Diospyros lotus TaxID=55363 RepID=UPI002251FF29|nr:subtilisin-like protease SBT3.3 [Diospyros lotus]
MDLVNYQIMLLRVSNSPTILIAKGEDQASIQIVYMAKSKNSAASHIQTLASVLGSEMEAKKAIIYDYTRTINGFAAKLTTDQITALLKQPGVLKIVPSEFQNVAANVSSSSVP